MGVGIMATVQEGGMIRLGESRVCSEVGGRGQPSSFRLSLPSFSFSVLLVLLHSIPSPHPVLYTILLRVFCSVPFGSVRFCSSCASFV